jgi:Mn2+/Fe2+ NRAMP family transporter
LNDVHKEKIGKEESVEKDSNVQNQSVPKRKSPHWLKSLGPGIITGASDDDPSGIATYSQAGA